MCYFAFLCILVFPLPSLVHLLHYGCRNPWFSGHYFFQLSHISFSTFHYYPFKFSHLSSVVPCLKHCTSSSISFLNNSTLVTRLSNFHLFCCFLLGIFFNRIATRLW